MNDAGGLQMPRPNLVVDVGHAGREQRDGQHAGQEAAKGVALVELEDQTPPGFGVVGNDAGNPPNALIYTASFLTTSEATHVARQIPYPGTISVYRDWPWSSMKSIGEGKVSVWLPRNLRN